MDHLRRKKAPRNDRNPNPEHTTGPSPNIPVVCNTFTRSSDARSNATTAATTAALYIYLYMKERKLRRRGEQARVIPVYCSQYSTKYRAK